VSLATADVSTLTTLPRVVCMAAVDVAAQTRLRQMWRISRVIKPTW
jgi:hypothetical protein